jgi:phage protein D
MPDNTAPAVEIKCDGNPLPSQAKKMLTEIQVESRLDLPGSFTVTLADSSLAFIDKEEGPLREGVRLEIALGYEKDIKTLITGEIGTVGAEISSRGFFSRIAGFDMLHRLARGTNYRHYESNDAPPQAISDSVIAETLIKAAGLTPKTDSTHSRSLPRTQDNRSDLDFLFMLAKINGYYLYSEDERVFFTLEPPDRGEISLVCGKDINAFYPRLSLNSLVKTLETRGRDIAAAEIYQETLDRKDFSAISAPGQEMLARGSGGRSSEDRSILNLHSAMISDANDAKPFLAGLMKEKQAIITARGSGSGNPEIRAGTVLKITEAGRFSGSYLVINAIHRFSVRGYSTDFELRMKL